MEGKGWVFQGFYWDTAAIPNRNSKGLMAAFAFEKNAAMSKRAKLKLLTLVVTDLFRRHPRSRLG